MRKGYYSRYRRLCEHNAEALILLRDSYGRTVTNLRISVTQRCNLGCPFCHKEGDERTLQMEMTPPEIQRIVSVAATLGVDNVKLTGGEPLLRDDIIEVVARVSDVRGISDIGITTNGILLKELAKPLKMAGLHRVNVSLGTLREETYRKTTGVNSIDRVLGGVFEASRVGLNPMKLNMVVLKGVNDDQVWEMLDFSRSNNLVLQLIEVEAETSKKEFFRVFHKDLADIEQELRRRSERVIIREMQHRQKFYLKGGGEVEVVRPMHNTDFCDHCNRMRLTTDGKLKPCLFRSDSLIDILGPLRKNASDIELQALFMQAVNEKRPFFTRSASDSPD